MHSAMMTHAGRSANEILLFASNFLITLVNQKKSSLYKSIAERMARGGYSYKNTLLLIAADPQGPGRLCLKKPVLDTIL